MEMKVVYITTSNREEAQKIGLILVKERLAACVNILGETNSIYWWEDKIEESEEVALIAKTEAGLMDNLMEKIRSIHSYDCPCIVSWKLDQMNPDYQKWLEDVLSQQD